MNGDPVQISMHSNLIYSAFDPRFNVVSLPYLFSSVEDADQALDGAAGDKLKDILSDYGLHCMGIAENGFRQLTNSCLLYTSALRYLRIKKSCFNMVQQRMDRIR